MLPTGPFANRYSELRLVGSGGFGEVYRAWDTELDRDVALKLLNPGLASDPDWRRRFRQEASAASKLNHPNITIVHDRGEFQGRPYIVMEFVEGEPLSKVIQDRVPLSDPERLFLIEQLCDGLHYAHQRHIVHRDVKPINLVVREEHDGVHATRTLKILDFGIAKVVNASQTATSGQLMFTPNYVAPELIRGLDADHRSDMFAVGAVAYELLVLEKAFEIKNKNPFFMMDELKQVIVDRPHRPMTDLRSDLDPELVAIVDCALEKIPENRYRDLAEMRRRIRRVRERLEADLAKRGSQTTIVLNPKLQAEVKLAREELDADDPTAAVKRLEGALGMATSDVVRRFIEESLVEARERQTVKRQEREAEVAREAQAAREAIDAATALFERGDATAAIEALERFLPSAVVADRIALFSSARGLIERASRAVAEGDREARMEALREIDEFPSPTLVAGPRARLQDLAARRLAAEKLAEEAAAEAERRERDAEIARVRRAIESAADVVRTGSSDVRAHALDELAAVKAAAYAAEDLANALTELRQLAQSRDEADAKAAADAAALVAAQAAADKAAAERADEEAAASRARAVIDTAFERYESGAREEAVAALEAFDDPSRVANALQRLRGAVEAIRTTAAIIDTGDAASRDSAIDRLRRFRDPTLVATAADALQARADARRLQEDRAAATEHEKNLAREAAAAIADARALFIQGERQPAIALLDATRSRPEVGAALQTLRSVDDAIEAATRAIESGDEAARNAALTALARIEPRELAAFAFEALQSRAVERTANERAAAIEREKEVAREAATSIDEAHALFVQGDRQRAIALLDAKRSRPEVSAALQTLRSVDDAIEAATRTIDSGDEVARTAVLTALGGIEPRELAAPALESLRVRADRRTADEHAAIEREKELVREAVATIADARAHFIRGDRQRAIALLDAKRARPEVGDALQTLRSVEAALEVAARAIESSDESARDSALAALERVEPRDLAASAIERLRARADERSAEERERREWARATIDQARAGFAAGDVEGSVRLLEAFPVPALVAMPLAALVEAADEIDRARAAIATESAPRREAALSRLAGLELADLYALALNELRQQHDQRTAEEARLEALRLAQEAERVQISARGRFTSGDYDGALSALRGFAPLELVEDALAELNAAAGAIARARRAVDQGDDDARVAAIDELRTFAPADLAAQAIEDFKTRHLQRRAEEQEAKRRYEQGVAAAREEIAGALGRKAIRAGARAIARAERAYPGEPQWASAREELAALRDARAAEPSVFSVAAAGLRRRALPLAVAIAAMVVLAAGGVLYFVGNPIVATLPLPEPPQVARVDFPRPTSTPREIPAPPMARLVINALPWAEILEIRNADQELMNQVPARSYTPFAVDLPIGQYTVTLRGPAGTGSRTVPVTITTEGGSALGTFRVVGADEYFKRAGS